MDIFPDYYESSNWQPEPEPDMATEPGRDRAMQKARALLATPGAVRLTPGGASVTNGEGHIYRVDFDLGGGPNCQCPCFQHRGYCKHHYAAQMAYDAAMAMSEEFEDNEPSDEDWYQELERGYWRDVWGGR